MQNKNIVWVPEFEEVTRNGKSLGFERKVRPYIIPPCKKDRVDIITSIKYHYDYSYGDIAPIGEVVLAIIEIKNGNVNIETFKNI